MSPPAGGAARRPRGTSLAALAPTPRCLVRGPSPPHRARCARPPPPSASAGAARPCRLPPHPVAGRLPPPTYRTKGAVEMATAAAWGSGRHGCGGGSRTRADRRWGRRFRTGAGRGADGPRVGGRGSRSRPPVPRDAPFLEEGPCRPLLRRCAPSGVSLRTLVAYHPHPVAGRLPPPDVPDQGRRRNGDGRCLGQRPSWLRGRESNPRGPLVEPAGSDVGGTCRWASRSRMGRAISPSGTARRAVPKGGAMSPLLRRLRVLRTLVAYHPTRSRVRLPPPTSLGSASPEMATAAAWGSGRHGCGGGSRTRADRRWGRRFRGAGRGCGRASRSRTGLEVLALRYRATRRFLRRGHVALLRRLRALRALPPTTPPGRGFGSRPSIPDQGRRRNGDGRCWGSGRHGCGGGSRTRDLQVMSLTRYHFSTPRWKAEGSRAPSLVKYGRPPKGPEPASQTRAETQKTQMHPAEWKARFRDFRPATGAEYPPERDLGPAVAPIFGPPGERTEDC